MFLITGLLLKRVMDNKDLAKSILEKHFVTKKKTEKKKEEDDDVVILDRTFDSKAFKT